MYPRHLSIRKRVLCLSLSKAQEYTIFILGTVVKRIKLYKELIANVI